MNKIDEKKTAPRVGTVGKKYAACDATEINVAGYSKIILFRDESKFLAFLEGNNHLKPIYGMRDYEKQLFPDVFVAAVRTKKL